MGQVLIIEGETDIQFLVYLRRRLYDGNAGPITGDERRDLANRLEIVLARGIIRDEKWWAMCPR